MLHDIYFTINRDVVQRSENLRNSGMKNNTKILFLLSWFFLCSAISGSVSDYVFDSCEKNIEISVKSVKIYLDYFNHLKSKTSSGELTKEQAGNAYSEFIEYRRDREYEELKIINNEILKSTPKNVKDNIIMAYKTKHAAEALAAGKLLNSNPSDARISRVFIETCQGIVPD